MAGEAVLQTSLSREDLYPEVLAKPDESSDRISVRHNRLYFFDPHNAGRASSLILDDGDLILGNVQQETSPLQVLTRERSLQSIRNVTSSILLELERVFARPLGHFHPILMRWDGDAATFPPDLAGDLNRWSQEYKRSTDKSRIGKPTIEDHFRKNRHHVSSQVLRQFYGEQIYQLLLGS